jgi:hypothetical protein
LLSKNLKIKIFRIIILPVLLHGCETWSRAESRLSVFENRVLRRLFGRKGDVVTREWRQLHKEELVPSELLNSMSITLNVINIFGMSIFFFTFENGSQAVILSIVTCRGRNISTHLDLLRNAYICLCASSGRQQQFI